MARQGIQPRTSDLRIRCPTDCATWPGWAQLMKDGTYSSPFAESSFPGLKKIYTNYFGSYGGFQYRSSSILGKIHQLFWELWPFSKLIFTWKND